MYDRRPVCDRKTSHIQRPSNDGLAAATQSLVKQELLLISRQDVRSGGAGH